MPIVKKISIREKIARDSNPEVKLVCNNSDYVVEFDWDEEWDEHEMKTARFSYGGKFKDIVFSGRICEVPVLHRSCLVKIGLFAGELRTTTAAMVGVTPSILCESGFPDDYSPEMGDRTWEGLDARIAELEKQSLDEIGMLIETDLLPATYNADGKILTNEDGKILLRY